MSVLFKKNKNVINGKYVFLDKIYVFLFISVVYFFSHGFLLIATGRWWDDWLSFGYNYSVSEALRNMLVMGRPSSIIAYIINIIIPYKKCTFLMYYIGSFLYYDIMRKAFLLDLKESLIITLIYICIPAFDARIMRCVFAYSTGYFFFILAFWMLVRTYNKNDKIPFVKGLFVAMLFIISFSLNSCLVFYAVPITWLCYKSISKYGIRNFIKHSLSYWYFFLSPFVFYFIKRLFFKPQGQYVSYNQVSGNYLLKAIWGPFLGAVSAFRYIISEELMYAFPVLILVVICVLIENRKLLHNKILKLLKKNENNTFVNNSKYEDKCNGNEAESALNLCEKEKTLALLGIGIYVMFFALFPYYATNNIGYTVTTFGFLGRHTILFPFGAAIFVYSAVSLLVYKPVRKYVFLFFILLGMVQFERWYIAYQKEYYRTVALERKLEQYSEISNYSTIIINKTYDGQMINEHSVYSLNAIFEEVYGDQSRYVRTTLDYDEDAFLDEVASPWYHMQDYTGSPNEVNAILNFSCTISIGQCLKLKMWEFFDKDLFYNWLDSNSVLTWNTIEDYNRYDAQAVYIHDN